MTTTTAFAWRIENPTAVGTENRNIANIIDLIEKKKKENAMTRAWQWKFD